MRLFAVVLAFAVLAVSLGGLNAVTTASCSDGTPYNGCSTKSPGYWCHGNLNSPTLDVLLTVCPCSKTAGWVQDGEGDTAVCIQAKCTDNTQNGQCSSTKPKLCVNGVLIDNATKCGCPDPAKQQVGASGLICVYKPCSDGTSDGACSSKTSGKKCVQGELVDKASDCNCRAGLTRQGEQCLLLCSDGTEDTKCSATKPKKCVGGYLLDAADVCGCPEGQGAVGKQCSSTAINLGGGADLLGGTTGGNSTGSGTTGSGASPFSCCCLPAALIGVVGGFAFIRKKDE